MENTYSILINTCDKFVDCWYPFFKLFDTYWKNCSGKIYLNTEYEKYYYNGIDINSTQVCLKKNIDKSMRATWSQCLKWALDEIDDEIILYLQEDYFFKDEVKNDLVEKYVSLMKSNSSIKCIHLTDQAVLHDGESEYEKLDKVLLKQRYRVSCQAALWRKSELKELIRENENAWEFEEFGSKRSIKMKSEYYVLSKDFVKLDQFEVIPYVFTGIIQGRWYEKVVPLFDKNNIKIDYSIRGFVKDAPPKALKKRIKYRLKKIIKIIYNQIDLLSIKQTQV